MADRTGIKIVSGADVPSFGITPKRVYSLNNGAGYATKKCRKCHAEYRVRESEPCQPGHMAAIELDPKAYAEGKRIEVGYKLPLGSEYMYHRGAKGRWSLPTNARKTTEVDGACQGIKRAVHERLDGELCRKCSVELLKQIATGKPMGYEVLTVTRRRGKIVHRNVVDITPSAEAVAIARLEISRATKHKPKAVKVVKAGTNVAQVQVTETPTLVTFAAIHYLAGASADDRPYELRVEARTIAEARKLFAEAFGVKPELMNGTNIYKVDETSGELRRVA